MSTAARLRQWHRRSAVVISCGQTTFAERYTDAVLQEIEQYATLVDTLPVTSFYVSGLSVILLLADISQTTDSLQALSPGIASLSTDDSLLPWRQPVRQTAPRGLAILILVLTFYH